MNSHAVTFTQGDGVLLVGLFRHNELIYNKHLVEFNYLIKRDRDDFCKTHRMDKGACKR